MWSVYYHFDVSLMSYVVLINWIYKNREESFFGCLLYKNFFIVNDQIAKCLWNCAVINRCRESDASCITWQIPSEPSSMIHFHSELSTENICTEFRLMKSDRIKYEL